MPKRSLGLWMLSLSCLVWALFLGCKEGHKPHPPAKHSHKSAPELAAYMSSMQRFSAKLGYAIQGKDAQLAAFYLHELEETTEDIIKLFPKYEGITVAAFAKSFLLPRLKPLEKSLKASDWKASAQGYKSLILGCNQCHSAAKHGFIRILVASGRPPYNQSFSAAAPAARRVPVPTRRAPARRRAPAPR